MDHMQVRFLTLNVPDIFTVLVTAAKLATAGKIPESVQIAPFDEKLLVADGFWVQANDIDCMKAVRKIESALRKDHPGLVFFWSPEPLARV
jgi:hypothetical protein